jgi:hypothetical protein
VKITSASRWVLLPLALLTVIGVALVPLSTGMPAGDSSTVSDFRAFMQPRLTALLASSEKVDSMVNERSRNILALRAESERMTTLVEEIDAYLSVNQVPSWAGPLIEDYRSGSDRVITAIDAANEAIRSFDFSRLTEMVPLFGEGTDLIERALRTLEESGRTRFVVH